MNVGFTLYQHENGLPILEATQYYFQTGRIYLKPGTNNIYVFEINDRKAIKQKVFPFIKKYVLPLGCKFNGDQGTFELMTKLIDLFELKKHLEPSNDGIMQCIEIAYETNKSGKGKKRKRSLEDIKKLVHSSKK